MKVCPKCKSNMIIDIVYGNLNKKIMEEVSQNKIAYGGSSLEPSKPKYKCKSCQHQFGGMDKFLNDEFIYDDL